VSRQACAWESAWVVMVYGYMGTWAHGCMVIWVEQAGVTVCRRGVESGWHGWVWIYGDEQAGKQA
jgi:hypothetical protein